VGYERLGFGLYLACRFVTSSLLCVATFALIFFSLSCVSLVCVLLECSILCCFD
jgi:hypothetical protein